MHIPETWAFLPVPLPSIHTGCRWDETHHRKDSALSWAKGDIRAFDRINLVWVHCGFHPRSS